jgi:endo-1,3(4)-beta-glucanase
MIVEECRKVELPSDEVMRDAVDRLRRGVEVWLNGTAEAPFLYDAKWGGLVSCGCAYDNGTCTNVLPDCPSFSDPGLNFGNGFFNDHHFHYGYHIYAAAVVANFDLNFGRKYFEPVLAMIRDIANPSTNDPYFPEFRQKDWYLGSSWASGIATLGGQPYLNGRNQESSSESIAAYEAISLYGAVMVHAWGDGVSSDVKENNNAKTATRVRDMGRLLTATEIRSAARYWHVLHGDVNTRPIYPKIYKPSAVGMVNSI